MGEVADYTRGEPAPVPNDGQSIHDLVGQDIQEHYTMYSARDVAALTCELFARKQFGFKKYGTYLQAHNGRNALNDAIDELCDLLVYVRQDMAEYPNHQVSLRRVYSDLLDTAIRLMHIRYQRTAPKDTD